MILTLRPPGRGNWDVVIVTVNRPADLFRFRVNQRFPFGDRVYRIVRIEP